MADIKALLEKTMLKIGGRAASPSSTSIDITITRGGDTTYTAPTDGFVAIAADLTTGKRLLLGSEKVEVSSINYAGNSLMSFTLPVRKGASAQITNTQENGTVYFCRFIKSIGGG